MKAASTHSTSPLHILDSELITISMDLEGLHRRVRQLAERIALASGEVFSRESAGGNNGVRPSLLSAAVETLLALPMSREDAAVRRHREAIHLLERVAGLQEDAERVLLDCPEAVAHYLTARHGRVDQEIMGALYLDIRNRLIADKEARKLSAAPQAWSWTSGSVPTSSGGPPGSAPGS